MKNIIFLLLIVMIGHAQVQKPVSWKTMIEKKSNQEYDLIIEATLKPGYHLYSQIVPDNGPLPTVFKFKRNKNYKLIGDVKEDVGLTSIDPIFGIEIKSFVGKTIFKQRIKIKNKKKFKITGEITFMTCNNQKCLRGNQILEFEI